MCLICGEGMGYFDDGSPCWGCNFSYCPGCGIPVITKGLCEKCLTTTLREMINVKECCVTIDRKYPSYLRRFK